MMLFCSTQGSDQQPISRVTATSFGAAEFWGVRGTRAEAFAAVVVGAKKTGIGALRSLLPARHAGAMDCNSCSSTGWYDMQGQLRDSEGKPFSIICSTCAGLGWVDASIVLTESVLEMPRA